MCWCVRTDDAEAGLVTSVQLGRNVPKESARSLAKRTTMAHSYKEVFAAAGIQLLTTRRVFSVIVPPMRAALHLLVSA